MSKTYSVCFLTNKGYWVTNWDQYFNANEIDFEKIESYVAKSKHLGFGIVYGNHSRYLISMCTRTVVWIDPDVLEKLEGLKDDYITKRQVVLVDEVSKTINELKKLHIDKIIYSV